MNFYPFGNSAEGIAIDAQAQGERRRELDDVRYVLAVAESGSVSAAARALGVNHATVLRRIAAFEEAQGAPVFDRTAQGYAVPPEKLRVIEAAREAAQAIEAVARHMTGNGTGAGAVRVTSTDSLCASVLPPSWRIWRGAIRRWLWNLSRPIRILTFRALPRTSPSGPRWPCRRI